MSYLKPVVVASTMLVASLSAAAFADHMNYAATMQPQSAAVFAADRNSPKSDVSCFNWEKRIFVGGLLNVDAVYSERGWVGSDLTTFKSGAADFQVPPFQSSSVHGSDIVVNNANLFVDAKINSATTAHVGLVYAQRPGESGAPFTFEENSSTFADLDEWDSTAASARFSVDEAYILFHDCASPFYFQAGKKFTSFSNYDPYPVTYSLTQLLAQTDEEVLEFGYNSNDGIHASIYAFNGPFSGRVTNADNLTSRISNYGVDFSYSAQYDNINYQLGAGYVKDIRDSSFLAHKIMNNANLSPNSNLSNADTLSHPAGAYALHANMNNGPLMLAAEYVAAVKTVFDTSWLADYMETADIDSRLWAYGLEAGYGFDSMGYASKASLGYQRSGNASLLAMPRYRVLADYTVEVSKNAKITLEYAHSRDYKASDTVAGNECSWYQNATNNTSNTATLRVGVAI